MAAEAERARRHPARVAGLLLAAGAGRRMGVPKALVLGEDDVPWAVRSARILADAGCSPVHVTVGAEQERVLALLGDEPVEAVVVPDWATGMAASLRAGLRSMPDDVDCVVIHLVDLPGVTSAAVRRVLEQAGHDALARAAYDGRPGHPVLLGRSHWAPVMSQAAGDRGAGAYLAARDTALVECADIATGDDVDTMPSVRVASPPLGARRKETSARPRGTNVAPAPCVAAEASPPL